MNVIKNVMVFMMPKTHDAKSMLQFFFRLLASELPDNRPSPPNGPKCW